jgi:hypothetical protein
LNFRLLARALQLSSHRLKLIARRAQLSQEHGKIQQTRHDEQQRPAEAEQGD